MIGFRRHQISNESGIAIRQADIEKRFSVDKNGLIYRIEVYREKKFSGMVLVAFSGKPKDLHAAISDNTSRMQRID